MLASDHMTAQEIDIFHGAMKWLKGNAAKTGGSINVAILEKIVNNLRFTFMTSRQLLGEVKWLKPIKDNAMCSQKVQAALNYVDRYESFQYAQPMGELVSGERARGQPIIIALTAVQKGQGQGTLMNLVFRSSTPPKYEKIPLFRLVDDDVQLRQERSHSEPLMVISTSQKSPIVLAENIADRSTHILSLGNFLFLIKGTSLWRYSSQLHSWMQLRGVPEKDKVRFQAAAVHDRFIYALGAKPYKYSILRNTWEQIKSIPSKYSSMAACGLGESLFVVGNETKTVYAYNTTTEVEEWSQTGELHFGRTDHRLCSVNDKLYLIGGVHKYALSVCEEYNEQTNKWTLMENNHMPYAVASPSVCSYNNKIIVLGGIGDNFKVVNCVQIFDTVKRVWTSSTLDKHLQDRAVIGFNHYLPLVVERVPCVSIRKDKTKEAPIDPAKIKPGRSISISATGYEQDLKEAKSHQPIIGKPSARSKNPKSKDKNDDDEPETWPRSKQKDECVYDWNNNSYSLNLQKLHAIRGRSKRSSANLGQSDARNIQWK